MSAPVRKWMVLVSDEGGLPRAWGMAVNYPDAKAEAERQWTAYVASKAGCGGAVRGRTKSVEVDDHGDRVVEVKKSNGARR